MSNRISIITFFLLFFAWLLGLLGLAHNEKVASNKIRGKRGANKANILTNDKTGRCMVCHKLFMSDFLVVAHYLGDKECSKDHDFVCPTCTIPEGWYGCGCGG